MGFKNRGLLSFVFFLGCVGALQFSAAIIDEKETGNALSSIKRIKDHSSKASPPSLENDSAHQELLSIALNEKITHAVRILAIKALPPGNLRHQACCSFVERGEMCPDIFLSTIKDLPKKDEVRLFVLRSLSKNERVWPASRRLAVLALPENDDIRREILRNKTLFPEPIDFYRDNLKIWQTG